MLTQPSKIDLCRQLHQPWRRGADDLAECRVADIAVHGRRPVELSVVEDVERFQPELQRLRLRQAYALRQRHIEVLDTWAVKKPPGRRRIDSPNM